MCSDPDSYLVQVADAYWNVAKGCVMSYIITHSEIILQIPDFAQQILLLKRGTFLFAQL